MKDDQGLCELKTCKNRKFLDLETGTCEKCHESCETCDEADVCLTCPNDQNLINGICTSYCAFNCESCEGEQNECLNCAEYSTLESGQCVCDSGFYGGRAAC